MPPRALDRVREEQNLLKLKLFCWKREPCLIYVEADNEEGDVILRIRLGNRLYD